MVSLSNSSRLPDNTAAILVNPVTLPPGRARLSMSPAVTGSETPKKMMGIVLVEFLAAIAAGVEVVTSTSSFETDQFISQGGKSCNLVISISILDSYVLAVNIAEFIERF